MLLKSQTQVQGVLHNRMSPSYWFYYNVPAGTHLKFLVETLQLTSIRSLL